MSESGCIYDGEENIITRGEQKQRKINSSANMYIVYIILYIYITQYKLVCIIFMYKQV